MSATVLDAPPANTPEWLAWRKGALDVDEMHTADRGALAAYRVVERELLDRLPYVEQDAVVMTNPGMTHPDAGRLLDAYAEGGGATEAA